MLEILVLYYSATGSTKLLANLIARGIESLGDHVTAVLRTVPKVSASHEKITLPYPESGDPYVTLEDLSRCSGLALGSPVRFGNMSSHLKYFLDNTSNEWLSGVLVGKPACVFTSGGSMHGGQESCLISMMLPLIHHGMLIMSLPFTNQELISTKSGGTPYGASHVAGLNNELPISDEEKKLAFIQGQNLANLCLKLAMSN